MAKFDASNIKEKTNYLVAYDLMKGRDELKRIKIKHFTYIFIAVLVLAGGTFSVDAMTDNSISNTIKEALKINVNKKDYNATCDKMDNGNVKCNLGSEVTGGRDFALEIDKENLDKLDKIQFIVSESNQNSEEN